MAAEKKSNKGKTRFLGGKASQLLGPKIPPVTPVEGENTPVSMWVSHAVTAKRVSEANAIIRDRVNATLESLGISGVTLRVSLTSVPADVDTYVNSVIRELHATPGHFFKELQHINIVTTDVAASEKIGGYTVGTKSEVYTEPDLDPDTTTTRKTALNFFIDPTDAMPKDEVQSLMAHEMSHVKEREWADSLFIDYAWVTTGNRLTVNDAGTVAVVVAQDTVSPSIAAQLQLLSDKCKKDPAFAGQMAFIKEWEQVSAYKLRKMEAPDRKTGAPTRTVGWSFEPPEQDTSILTAAFGIGEIVKDYVVKDSRKIDKSPSEELAEALRVSRHPMLDEHLARLERENPAAKRYLEGLLRVLANHDDLVKDRLLSLPPGQSVLRSEPVKTGRGRPSKPKTVMPKEEKPKRQTRKRKVSPEGASTVIPTEPPTDTNIPF